MVTKWIEASEPEQNSDTYLELPLFKKGDASKTVHPITVDMEIDCQVLRWRLI